MDYKLQDLIDIAHLQNLLDTLNEIYAFPSAIIDNEGNILTATGWQDICTRFHRVNKQAELECIKSDQYIANHLSEANPAVSYRCPHGMIDNAVPIIINGIHMANFFTGQLFTEKPNLDFFKEQARKYNFNETGYLEAVKKVPVWPQEKLSKYLVFIKSFTQMLAEIGYKQLQEIEHRKELEKKEKELINSETKFRAIFENSHDAIGVSKKGTNIFINPAYVKMFGYDSEKEMIGQSILEQIAPKERERILNYVNKRSNKENVPNFYQTIGIRKNGEEFPFEVRVDTYIMGNEEYTIGIIRDITLNKQTEKQLKEQNQEYESLNEELTQTNIELKSAKQKAEENERKYKMLFDTITEGVALNEIVYNENHEMIDYKIIEVNKAFCDFSGISNEEALNNYASVLYKMDNEFVKEFWLKHKELKAAAYSEMYRPETNKYFYISTSPFINNRFVTVFFDITQLKKAEKQVLHAKELAERSQEKYMNAIADLNKAQAITKAGSWKWYINENKLEWSTEMYRIFGINEKSFTGDLNEVIQKAIHPDDIEKVEASNRSVAENGVPIPLEYRIVMPNGSIKYVWAEAGELINDSDNKPVLLTGIVLDITERKKIEDELSAKSKTLESIFNSAPYITMLIDENARLLDINRAGENFTGKSKIKQLEHLAGEALDCINSFTNGGCGKSANCINCPIRKNIKKTIETGEPQFDQRGTLEISREGQIQKKELLISTTIIPKEGSNQILLTLSDISEKILMQEALLISESNLAEAQHMAQIGSWEWDMQANKVFWSKEMYHVFDFSPDEFDGKPATLLKAIHPDDVEKYINSVETNMKTGNSNSLEYRVIRKDKSVHYIHAQGQILLNDKGMPIRAFGTAQDITERKLAEEALRQSEDNYRRFMDESTLGIRIIDTKGNTVYVNKALLDIYGFDTQEEFFRTPVSKRYTAKEYLRHQKRKEERRKGKALSTDYEIEIIRRDGELRYLQVNRKEIIWNKNIHYQIIYQDITARKIAEEELLVAKEKAEESDRLKTAFLQNMSHEIRTPMNAINGFVGMLNKPGITDEKRNSFISIIKNSSNQLLSIVSDILTISSIDTKQEKIDIQNVNINNVLVDLLSIMKTQAFNQNISLFLKQSLNDKQAEIYTDKTKLNQILTNLITNALKFTHQGFIEFGYSLVNIEDKQYLQFYVKDTGIGIETEQHQKIFERFRQADLSISRKYGGTGLGLSISKGFVDLMGGKIWVDSIPEKGSTFYFTIPYQPSNADSLQVKPSKGEGKILIAEDEEYNFLLIEEIINEYKYEIVHAKNGQEAIDCVIEMPEILAVIMDIKMPVMDGHTAALKIKETRPELPVIALTAYALDFEREKFKNAFNDYITKPLNELELKEKLKKYINLEVFN